MGRREEGVRLWREGDWEGRREGERREVEEAAYVPGEA